MGKDKENYGSRFLYAENLLIGGQYKSVEVEIAEYHPPGTLRSADGSVIPRPAIGFKDKDKLLVLNKTNESLLTFVCGDQPGPSWIGKKITLRPSIVEGWGEQLIALRVMPPKGCLVRKNLLKRLGRPAKFEA